MLLSAVMLGVCAMVPTAATQPASRPTLGDEVRTAVLAAATVNADPLIAGKQIADRYGRAAAEPLAGLLQEQGLPQGSFLVVSSAMVEIADPDGRQGVRSAWRNTDLHDAAATAVAALAALDGQVSRDLLVRLVTGEHPRTFVAFRAMMFACGLLRSADAASVEPRIEAALRTARGLPRTHLAALMSSLQYGRSLSDADQRAAYLSFERRLWWHYALADKGSAIGWYEYRQAARRLASEMTHADEPFVLRIFQDPLSTPEETEIAIYLTGYFQSATLNDALREVAAGNTPKAAAARRALVEVDRRAGSASAPSTQPAPADR